MCTKVIRLQTLTLCYVQDAARGLTQAASRHKGEIEHRMSAGGTYLPSLAVELAGLAIEASAFCISWCTKEGLAFL